MEALLRYAVTSEPFPLRAGTGEGDRRVPVKVIATNPSPDPDKYPVDLQGIIVALPIGDAADQLTESAVDVGPVPPDGWRMREPNISTGLAEFVFEPEHGTASVGGQSVEFAFDNVVVNAEPGTVCISVTERTGDCQEGDCPAVDVNVTKFPTGWGDVAFWTSPPNVPRGGSTTLHWAGPAGATYSIQYYDWRRGILRQIPGSGQVLAANGAYPGPDDPPLSLVRETIFTLNVELTDDGQTYVAQDQQIVSVLDDRVEIVSIKAVPDLVAPHDAVALQWKTQGASAWSISGPDLDETDVPVPESDAEGFQVQPGYEVHPAAPARYTLEASDAQGNQLSADALVDVDDAVVNDARTVTFAAAQGATGPPGDDGQPPEYPAGPGHRGGRGDAGPGVAVEIDERRGYVFVLITPDKGPAQSAWVSPAGHLTIRTLGGQGGTGGPGGEGGAEGGPGGPGGPGGTVTVRCPEALRAGAQALLTLEASGGPGGIGGQSTNYGGGRAGPGPPGPQGNVVWLSP